MNPVPGRPEAVWSLAGPAGESTVWSYWTGTRWASPVALSPEMPGPREPRLSFLEGGGTAAAWLSDGDVHYRERPGPTESWTSSHRLNEDDEMAGRPDLADPGDGARVSFPLARPSGWEIVVESRVGPPGTTPVFIREFLALSACTGDPGVRVEQQGGLLWITWRQDESDLAWSRLEPAGWTAPSLVPIPEGEALEAARFQAKLEALH